MPAHIGPVLAFMAILALAGVQKMADPEPTAGALAAAGFPSSRIVVFGLGGFELATGLAGIAIGGPVPAIVAAGLYSGFALFVANALVRDLPIRSCGCLGATDTPPNVVHVLINLGAVATMVVAAFRPIDLIAQLPTVGLGSAIAFALFTIGAIYLIYGALTVLPLTMRRPVVARETQSFRLSERSR